MAFWNRPPPRPGRASVVAAGVRVAPNEQTPAITAGASQRLLLQGWQWDAFRYYNSIGEIWFGGQFYARGLQNLRLYVGRKDENNEIEEVDNNAAAMDLLNDVQDPGGGRAGMFAAYGQLMWLIGEGYMLVTPSDGDHNDWEFVSPSELQVWAGRGGLMRQPSPGLPQRQIRYVEDPAEWQPDDPDTGIVYRYWRRHPQFSAAADAPMRGVLLLCDELERLTAVVRARSVSRLAGPGMLLIPDEISQPPPEPVGDEDPEEDIFMRDLIAATISPISDPGTASAQVPLLVRGAAEYLKEIRHVQIHDPLQTYPEEGLRSELIRRIETSLDFPVGTLSGLTGTNHWNAWAISEETWRSHLQPVAQRFCEDLTASYFRPAARDAGVEGWQDLVIWYDAAAVINHPDRGKDALDVWDRGGLSLEALREAKGFDDDDAPPEQDRAERIGIATRDSSLAWFGVPSVRGPAIEPEAGEIEPTSDPSATPPGDGTTGAETDKAPPEPPSAEPVTAALRALVAAELTLDRCRELAGSRIVTKLQASANRKACPDCAALVKNVPLALVASVLGDGGPPGLPSARELVAGGASAFRDRVIAWGADPDRAALLAEQLEQHAARTLFDENPPMLPATFAARLAA